MIPLVSLAPMEFLTSKNRKWLGLMYLYIHSPYHTQFRAPTMSISLRLSWGIIAINFTVNWRSGLQHFQICTQIFPFVNKGSSLHSYESAHKIHIYISVILLCLCMAYKSTLNANEGKSNQNSSCNLSYISNHRVESGSIRLWIWSHLTFYVPTV